MEFATKVTDIDIWNHPDGCLCEASEATVEWHYEIEARSWGIKGAYATIDSVYCCVTATYETGDDFEEIEIEINSKDGWTVEDEGFDDCNLSQHVCPENVAIDFKTKTITVSF